VDKVGEQYDQRQAERSPFLLFIRNAFGDVQSDGSGVNAGVSAVAVGTSAIDSVGPAAGVGRAGIGVPGSAAPLITKRLARQRNKVQPDPSFC